MLNLNELPPPNIVAGLDFEQIFEELKNDFLKLYPDAKNVLQLESEPIVKLLQAAAYRELLLRNLINVTARSNLLAFATGADLDHKAAFYNVSRLINENDVDFRLRIQNRIAALAGNGTAEAYKYTALSASQNVKAANVRAYAPGKIQLTLWLRDLNLQSETIAQVSQVFNLPGNRPAGIDVTIQIARPVYIDIVANIWREAQAPADILATLAIQLKQKIADYSSLGRGMPLSWISAQLQMPGVSRVEFPDMRKPAQFTSCLADQYLLAGEIQLSDQGVA